MRLDESVKRVIRGSMTQNAANAPASKHAVLANQSVPCSVRFAVGSSTRTLEGLLLGSPTLRIKSFEDWPYVTLYFCTLDAPT